MGDSGQCTGSIRRRVGDVACVGQHLDDQIVNRGLIIDDQDAADALH